MSDTHLINAHTHYFFNCENATQLTIPYPLERARELDKLPDYAYFTLGIHPWQGGENSIQDLEGYLQRYSSHPRFLGLGEVGLDRVSGDLEEQVKLLKKQLALVEKYQIKRVVIHCVRTHEELFQELSKLAISLKIIWHGIKLNTKQYERLERLAHKSFYGIGELIHRSSTLRETLSVIKPEQILLETDGLPKKYDEVEELKQLHNHKNALQKISSQIDWESQLNKNWQDFVGAACQK